jgi:hypothetical protein
MVGGRWLRSGAALIAFWCASCGASNPPCTWPSASTTEAQGELEVYELNEFSVPYRVVSVAYTLDGCDVHYSRSPEVGKQTLVVEPRMVSAGPHKFRFAIRFRDVFGALPADDQIIANDLTIDVHQDGRSSITVRMFDDPHAEPSSRIRALTMVARKKNPPAEAAAR